MSDLQKQRYRGPSIPRFLLRVAGIVVLGMVAYVAVRGAWNMYGKFSESAEGESAAQHELAVAQQQYAAMSAGVASLSTERGVEVQVRDRFGVARPGEGEIKIIRDQASATTTDIGVSGNVFIRIFRALFVW